MSPRRNRPRRPGPYRVHPSLWTCPVCGTWFATDHRCPGPETPLEGEARAEAIARVRAAIRGPGIPAPVLEQGELELEEGDRAL